MRYHRGVVFAVIVETLVLMLGSHAWGQSEVRFSGATTLEKLIRAKAGEIQSKHNVKLVLVPNGAGRGLTDLAAGRADAAMLAGPLSVLAQAVNAETPGAIKVDTLKEHAVSQVKVAFAIHPSNKVGELTLAQLKELLTGKARNWKEVGGPDLPVVVVIASSMDGTRCAVQASVLGADAYAKDARVLQLSSDLSRVVAQIPGAIGVMSINNKGAELGAVKTDKDVFMPVSLVTVGQPKDNLAQVIATVQSLVGDKNQAAADASK